MCSHQATHTLALARRPQRFRRRAAFDGDSEDEAGGDEWGPAGDEVSDDEGPGGVRLQAGLRCHEPRETAAGAAARCHRRQGQESTMQQRPPTWQDLEAEESPGTARRKRKSAPRGGINRCREGGEEALARVGAFDVPQHARKRQRQDTALGKVALPLPSGFSFAGDSRQW
jgi:hypothetical protein